MVYGFSDTLDFAGGLINSLVGELIFEESCNFLTTIDLSWMYWTPKHSEMYNPWTGEGIYDGRQRYNCDAYIDCIR